MVDLLGGEDVVVLFYYVMVGYFCGFVDNYDFGVGCVYSMIVVSISLCLID